MPRKTTSRIHDYFVYDVNRSICQLLNKEGQICHAAIKGKHAGNLEKHVKTWHEEDWKLYWNEKSILLSQSETPSTGNYATHFVNVDISEIQTEVIEYSPSTPNPTSTQTQTMPTSMPTSKKRKLISSNKSKILNPVEDIPSCSIEDAFIELVTLNGLPFSIVEESGFKKIISHVQPSKEKIQFHLSPLRLQKLVKMRADSIKSQIIKETEGRLICLRIECAIGRKKHYFSVAVHYRKKDQLRVFVLALIELPCDHSPDILKEEVLNVLVEYNINLNQIYYVLVDNSSQALKIAHNIYDLDTEPVDSVSCEEMVKFENDDYSGGYDSDFDIFDVEETELNAEDEGHCEIECDEEIYNNEVTDKLVENVINSWSKEENVIVCRSLTYAFQLVVWETFNEIHEVNVLMKKIRGVVKKMRSHAYLKQLRLLRCKKKPILDCKTRLLSTLDMLQRFIEIKPYIDMLSESEKEIGITLKEWSLIMEVVDSFQPLKTTITRLQQKDIPLSEFYKHWITCFLKTKKIDTTFSLHFCKNMDKFKTWLFNNLAFKTSLFFDPRFKNTLSSSDHDEIIKYLVTIDLRVKSLKSADTSNTESNNTTMDESQCIPKIENDDSGDDDLYQYVQSMVKTPPTPKEKSVNVLLALQTFKESEPILDLQNITAFWQERKHIFTDVYKLSQIIFGVPSTNSTLEKFISQLKYVSNLSAASATENRLLKDILLVRCNFDWIR